MRALKLQARVQSDHTLHLRLPEDIAEGPAEVIVLLQDPGGVGASASAPGSLEDFLAAPTSGPRRARTKEEIDESLRTERESWE